MKKILICLGLVLIAACGSKVDKRNDAAVKTDFYGPSLEDHSLTINPKMIPLKPTFKKESAMVSSHEILNLSSLFLANPNEVLKNMSNRLSEILNRAGETATSMTASVSPVGNPYGEQAYYYLKDYLVDQSGKALDAAVIQVTQAADKIPNDGAPEGASTIYYLQNIVSKLSIFVTGLNNSGPNNPIIETLTKKLSTDYIKPLSDFQSKLVWSTPQRIDGYFMGLQKSIATLPGLSDKDRRLCLAMVQEGVDYSTTLEAIKYPYDSLNFLIDLWLNKAAKNLAPVELANYLGKYSSKALLALVTDNKPVYDAQQWKVLKDRKSGDGAPLSNNDLLALATDNKNVLEADAWNTLTKQQTEFLNPQILSLSGVSEILESKKMNAGDTQERIKALVVYWLGLSRRVIFPDELAEIFNKYDDDDLKALHDPNWYFEILYPKLTVYRYGILNKLKKFDGPTQSGLRNFQILMRSKLFAEADSSLKVKLMALDGGLKDVVRSETVIQLEGQRGNFPGFAFEKFKEYALKYLNNWFFHERSLPLLEARNIRFEKQKAQWNIAGDLTETSGETIGVSLAHHYLEIQNGSLDKSTLAGFRAISKLSALSGYRDYNGQFVNALTLPFSEKNVDSRFEILKIDSYNPLDITFTVPDKVSLNGGFKADILKTVTDPAVNVSVQSQMALLQGYSSMMRYLKPWEPSNFDGTLGVLRISQFPDKEIFAKSILFKQALGLSLAVLKNIPARMIARLSSDGRMIFAPASAPGAVGAAMLSYNNIGISKKVFTADMAQSILALSDFFEVTADLNKSSDPELIASFGKILCDDPNGDQSPENGAAVAQICADSKGKPDSARKQVHALLTGLILFTINKLTLPDGGYVEALNADTLKPLSLNRKLSDQLIMEKAMLRAGQVLKSDAIKFKAVDNYFFINGKFWNSKIGFYSDSEQDQSGNIFIKNILLVIENLNSLNPLLTSNSLEQGTNLKKYLQSRLLSREVTAQTPLELLYPQTSLVP